ncbi:MAG: ATP-dependent DNA helicase RecG [Lysobacteraceae bacterium]|nr:MAG: ATP-dependent DNA helicase RecG [Xanthomonadaceae bacterium]
MDLNGPLVQLPGVGPAIAKRLAKLGIERPLDLLFHLPFRYEDHTRLTPIGELKPGQHAVVQGKVLSSGVVYRGRQELKVLVEDDSGLLQMRLFHFFRNQLATLAAGRIIRLIGDARYGMQGLEMIHPRWQILRSLDQPLPERLNPVYPATEGISQDRLAGFIASILNSMRKQAGAMHDLLPAKICQDRQWPALIDALELLHTPPADVDPELLLSGQHPAQQRLAFEELLAHGVSMRMARQRVRLQDAPVLDPSTDLVTRFVEQLPFTLTGAQQRVVRELSHDLKTSTPCMRLVQGDVGSGKTVVAAAAALQAVGSSYQSAITAPTELLAEQHFQAFSQWCQPLGLKVTWLSGKVTGKARQAALQSIASDADIIVGTHALFQDEVSYRSLGLVVVDEQHRFGVQQRLALRRKGQQGSAYPHQIIMTATPIPRTLAMAAYADLDVSSIDELPPGRQAVNTIAIAQNRRQDVIDRIRVALKQGKQAYWVCTLIDPSDQIEAQAANEAYETLQAELKPLRVGLVHGRLKAAEKSDVMRQFKQGELDLLVATTVIEVGVDVPNASLMIIDNCERLGLAQLHQLRGRVGRGSEASTCLLLYQAPLSEMARKRIGVLRESNDGFEIARQDLELRGPGELLGTRQTGMVNFRLASLERDGDLLEQVHEHADELVENNLSNAVALLDRWLGSRQQFAEA